MAKLITAQDIIEILEKEVGIKESPANSNNVKYNTAYYGRKVSGSAYPWCCAFVWWVFQQAGASDLFYGGRKTAHCATLLDYHKKVGQSVTGNYKPGDVIFFNFSGGTSAKHVGVCIEYNKTKGTITTIDGNTGTSNEADGGAVMYRTRSIKYIVGAYRPAYDNAAAVKPVRTTYAVELPILKSGMEGDDVKALQILLTGLKHSTKGFDGKFGKNTETALKNFQKEKKLDQDGKCGPATWKELLGV